MSGEAEQTKLATVVWEGDSREVLKAFPEQVTQNLGFELWLLQQGEKPRDYRPVSSVGPGVFELRDQDERAWYPVIYLSRIEDVILCSPLLQEEKSRDAAKGFREGKAAFQSRECAFGTGEER